jgi:hypothetical protein
VVALGLALLACVNADDDDTVGATDAVTGGTASTTASMTTTLPDDGAMTGSGDSFDTTAGPTDETAGTSVDPTGADDDATTGSGGDAIEACVAACEHGSTCESYDPKICPTLCEDLVASAEAYLCVREFIAQQTCIVTLDCTEYEEYIGRQPDGEIDYPCEQEDSDLLGCEQSAAARP